MAVTAMRPTKRLTMRRPAQPDHDAAEEPSTVLFLAANPLSNARIRLDEECREIEKKISVGRFGDRLRFRSRWAVRPDDLLFGLLEDEPSALHFSGHGAGHEGLCFQAEDGNTVSVTAAMLNEVMHAAEGRVKVVVLNACHSEVQARAVIAHVPCVIGAPRAIADGAAIAYCAAFYRALAYAHSVASAHQHGLAALAIATGDGPDRDVDEAKAALCRPTPVLLTRSDVDAKRVYLVERDDRTDEVPVEAHAAQVHLELTIERDFDGLDADTLAEMMSVLRQLIRGKRVKIVCIAEGSVRLTIALCPEAASQLMELHGSGQFTQLCGSAISNVVEVARVQGNADVARLLWRDAQGVEGALPLTEAEIKIGRAMDCAIRTDDATVSRHHSRVFWGGGGYILEDLSSANGVYFEGQRIQRHMLKHGDAIRCGSLRMRFVDRSGASEAAQPAGVAQLAQGSENRVSAPPPVVPAPSHQVAAIEDDPDVDQARELLRGLREVVE
jgi:hypothetical protein